MISEEELACEGQCWTCTCFRFSSNEEFACIESGAVKILDQIMHGSCKKYIPYLIGGNLHAVADCRICSACEDGKCDVVDGSVDLEELYHGWCSDFIPMPGCIDPIYDREGVIPSEPVTDIKKKMEEEFWRLE